MISVVPQSVPQIVKAWLRQKSARSNLLQPGNLDFASRVKAPRKGRPLEVVTLADVFESHAEAVYFFINRLDGHFCDLLTEIEDRGKDSRLTVDENTNLRSFVIEWHESLASARLNGFPRTRKSLQTIVDLSDKKPVSSFGKDVATALGLEMWAETRSTS